MAERCPTCGGAVKIVLGERQCYESVMQEEIERLSHLHDLDHKLADRFRTERDEAREVLCTLHAAVVNIGGGPLHGLYQNSDIRNMVEKALGKEGHGRAV